MKSCPNCSSANSPTAKFCQECGQSLLTVAASSVPVVSAAVSDLSRTIARCREIIKNSQEPIPAAKNAAVAPLMGSLQAIPPEAQEARIAIIEALGKTREPVILRSLLMVSGARAKDVRRAVAVALGSIRHSLSAYILLPMLDDGSSRVRNAAIQALILIEQAHCMEAIFAACLKSQTLNRITCDTIQRMKPYQRARFARELNQLPYPQSDAAITIRRHLMEFCEGDGVSPAPPKQVSDRELEDSVGRTKRSAVPATQGDAGTRSARSGLQEQRPVQHEEHFAAAANDRNFAELETRAHAANVAAPAMQDHAGTRSARSGLRDVTKQSADSFSQVDRLALEANETEPEDAGDSMLARLMTDSVPEMAMPADLQTSRSFDEVSVHHSSNDSFADLSFFESVSQDLQSSSYSADMIPVDGLQNSSGSHSMLSGERSASSLNRSPSVPMPSSNRSGVANHNHAPGSGFNPAFNGRFDVHGGNASSIIRQAPSFSGLHSPQPSMPQQSWANNSSAAVMTPPEMSMRQAMPQSAAPPVYPPSSYVPAFSAPLTSTAPAMPVAPAMMPMPPMGMSSHQMDLQHSGYNIDTVTTSNPAAAQHGTSGVTQSATTHSMTVHVSEADITTTTTAETATPESTAAEIARVSQEKNLQRLREMRDRVFKALLDTQTPVTGHAPRLVSKKVSTLLTTPGTDIPSIRKHLISLGETESPHVIETINSFCQKPSKEIRLACAEALSFIRTPSSALLLLKFLSDKSGTVTEAAVKSLGKLGLPELHPVLLAAGLVNPSLRTVVTGSVEGSNEEQKNRWEQSLLTFSDSKDGELAAFAISLLSRITGATHSELFENTVTSVHASVRAASVDALVRTGKKRIIGHINDALVDSDANVRRHAAVAVATICSPRSVELLIKLLHDDDLSVRRTAASTAGKIDEPDLGEGIVKALEQEIDSVVVESLLEALQRNAGADGLSVLTRYVEGESKQYRDSALKALRKLKSPESVPVFRRLLDDSAPSIRKQCVEQLASMKVSAALPRFREMLRADSDENVRAACAKAVGELQDHTSLPLLEAALEDHPTVKFQAIIGLGKLGNASAGPSLLGLLEDTQPEIRYQAVKALGQLKLEGCEERVEPLLQDKDEMVRRGAEQTLLALGVSARQISRRKFRRRVGKVASFIAPSHLLGALPGRGGAIVAVAAVLTLIGGFWYLPGLTSLVSGSSSLPVFRVENVRLSSAADLAVVWRKQLVFDVAKASTGELQARIQAPSATRQVLVENKGGILILADKTLLRLTAESSFDPTKAKSKDFSDTPLAVCFHPKDNLCCVFLPKGSGTHLELLDAETLEAKSSHEIKAKFAGMCLVSPDRKMALSIAGKGEVGISELATGDVFTLDLPSLIKGGGIGSVLAVQFSQDMKYVCFCTSKGLYVFSVERMKLEKQIDDTDGFFAVTSLQDGRIRAVSSKGKVVELSSDLSSVTDKTIDGFFDLVDVDPNGNMIIVADSDAHDAEVFDIQQNKVIAKIVGE